jgi:uncharacterized protein YndB with AHSA1/START domain
VTTVVVPASPERTLRAFLDPEDLEGWWKVSRSLVEDHNGGIWAIAWDRYGPEQTNHVWTGVISDIGPRRLVIDSVVLVEPDRPLFAPLQIEVVTTDTPEGCQLQVVHRGYQYGEDWDWMHQTVVEGWRHVLGDLQEFLENR